MYVYNRVYVRYVKKDFAKYLIMFVNVYTGCIFYISTISMSTSLCGIQVNRTVYWWKYLMSNTFTQMAICKLYVEC